MPEAVALRHPRATATRATLATRSVPIKAAVASRLPVLAAGLLCSALGTRAYGWTAYDPSGISAHLGSAGNVLAATAVRWDGVHYLSVAAGGYRLASDTVFFPLYPLLIAGLATIVRSVALAGVLISIGSFVLALVLLHRLTVLELGERAADATVILLAFSPLTFFFSAVYTESLFLLLSVASIYAARTERWAAAGLLAALASATRVTGVLLVVPLAVMFLMRYRRLEPRFAWTLAAPAGAVAFLAYLSLRGYGLLAPFSQQKLAHQHSFTNPLSALILAWKAFAGGVGQLVRGAALVGQPNVHAGLSFSGRDVWLALVLVAALWAVRLSFRVLPRAYGCYGAAALLMCICSPSAFVPLESLDRYALVMFPLWMAAGKLLSERGAARAGVMGAFALAGCFFTFSFAAWAFVA